MKFVCPLALLAAAGTTLAQTQLYSVSFNGQLHTLNTATGAATLVGATGFDRLNSAAMDSGGIIYAGRGRNPTVPTDTNKLIKINPATGAGTQVFDFGGSNDLRGLAFANGDVLYALQDNATADSLMTVNLTTGVVTLVGATGRSDLQGLTATPSGELFAIGVSPAGAIYKLDPMTGVATLVPGSTAGNDNQAIEYASGTRAYAARANLVTIDLLTGATLLIGPTGLTDIRGLAGWRPSPGTPTCYANCDLSTAAPILNVNDFICFNNLFAAGDSNANCDQSTIAPVLNVNDFTCFLNLFAAGC